MSIASYASEKQLQLRSKVIPVHRRAETIAVMRIQNAIGVGSVTMIVAAVAGTVAVVPKVVDRSPEVLVLSVAIPRQLVRSAG